MEAMLCGHAFHTCCIDDYISATGKDRRSCCPLKCAQPGEFAIAEVDQTDAVDDSAGLAPVVIIDAVGDRLAEEALAAVAGIQ